MPVNDRGSRYPADSNDSLPAGIPKGRELDYQIEREVKKALRDADDLTPETDPEYPYNDIRNAYEGVIIEKLSDGVYKLLRQDNRTGTARSKNLRFDYKVGQTVTVVRPQEEEFNNDWYITTPPRTDKYHTYTVNVLLDSGEVKINDFVDAIPDSTATQEEFDERFATQDTALVVKKGGRYTLKLRGKFDGIDTENGQIIVFLDEDTIPGAVYQHPVLQLGFTTGYLCEVDKAQKRITVTNTPQEVCNMTPDAVGGLFIKCSPLGGLYIADLEPCGDYFA